MKFLNTALLALVAFSGTAFAEETTPQPITNPVGESKLYYGSETNVKLPFNDPYCQMQEIEGVAAEVVFGEDNKVYFKNPVSNIVNNTYIEGTLEDGVITVKLPQPIGTDVNNRQVYASRMQFFLDTAHANQTSYVPVSDADNIVTYDLLDDGSIKVRGYDNYTYDSNYTKFPMYGIGSCYYDDDNNLKWTNYVSAKNLYTTLTDQLVELPVGAEVQTWLLVYDDQARDVSVAFYGDDEVYIGNLYGDGLNGWVKGTVSGGIVSIPRDQLVGTYAPSNMLTYFEPVYVVQEEKQTRIYDKELGYIWVTEMVDVNKITSAFTLKLSSDKKKMTAEEGTMYLNKGKNKIDAVIFIGLPTFTWQDTTKDYEAPDLPEWGTNAPWDPNFGCGQWNIKFPKFDTTGRVLPLEKYFFNIYIDANEDPYVFKGTDYPAFSEDKTDIQVGLPSSTNIESTEIDGKYLMKLTYFEPKKATYFTVKSFYLTEDGTKKYSLPVEVDAVNMDDPTEPDPSGVSELGADKAQVEFFDLQGRKVANPENGLYIQISRLANGEVRAVKKAVK